MSRTGRLVVLAAAWTVPVCWTLLALLAGPSDGTSLTARTVPSADTRWDETVRVAATYGETPLRVGDRVQAIDGRAPGDWLAGTDGVRREVGDRVRYEVRRPGADLDLIQQVDVTLARYPLADAVRAAPLGAVVPVLLLLVGSLVYWSTPDAASSRALLAATALLPAAVVSSPWGLGAIDLAGGRGTWPQAVGEAAAAVGMAALVLAVALLTPPGRRGRVATALLVLAPLLAAVAWVAVQWPGAPVPTRRAALATLGAPALWVTVPAMLVAGLLAHLRAGRRGDVLATRLALLGVGAAVGLWLVLGPGPALVTGAAAVRQDLLVLLAGVVAVACVAAASAGWRLEEIEPRLRRGLVQGLVLVVVGAVFAAVVRAVDLATDVSVGSMLLGGVAALLLVPAAVGVQRAARRVVYGDREFPHRMVSELRRLDVVTAPEDTLREALELLARRLHLSFAAVDVRATPTVGALTASVGDPSGASPATVDLSVGGTTVGRLRLAVDPGHDPFGPGDRRLLEDVGAQVGALVQAVTANRELQVSRQRLVAAREEERRRLRRDLHDGLGPSLATLAMRLEAAAELVREDPEQAADLVCRLSDQAREDIGEVRRLVDGLRPPALDQLGLVSALRHRAADHAGGTGPVRVPWSVTADDDLEPLPAAVEVAAYRIVLEAVTNAQRHSGGDRCDVRLSRDGRDLHIDVSDTGGGLAPDRHLGVGLSSMRERAEELGGSCEVTTRAEGGTLVRVRLPLDAE
jgi:signal transduction histidine kinase